MCGGNFLYKKKITVICDFAGNGLMENLKTLAKLLKKIFSTNGFILFWKRKGYCVKLVSWTTISIFSATTIKQAVQQNSIKFISRLGYFLFFIFIYIACLYIRGKCAPWVFYVGIDGRL